MFPQFGELAKFNASEAVRSTLASPLITNGSLTTNYNTAISSVYIIVYEKYGTPPAIQLDATSNAIFVFNGALRHPDWIDFSFKDYDVSTTNNLTPGVLFLTSWPRARKTFCGFKSKYNRIARRCECLWICLDSYCHYCCVAFSNLILNIKPVTSAKSFAILSRTLSFKTVSIIFFGRIPCSLIFEEMA